MVVSRHQNVGQNHNLLILYISFENMANFQYLGTTVTIRISFTKKLEQIKLGNACYHYVQDPLSSPHLSRHLKCTEV